jgi:hypothetical protein
MSRLAELQHSFQQCLLQPTAQQTQPWVRSGGRAHPARQLAVYQHAYPARLMEVLGNDYPALALALGTGGFEQLAHDYIAAHPSQSFTLRDFGGRLADFIATTTTGVEQPWAAELARFEWSLGLAFDAADTPLAGVEHMAAIAPPHWPVLHFSPHPSVQRLDFCWNTPGMWSALTSEPPQPVSAAVGDTAPWLIWREQLTTRFRSLARDEAAALDCLCRGASFGDACAQLAEYHDDDSVPLRAASLLKGWLAQGLISQIHTPPELS